MIPLLFALAAHAADITRAPSGAIVVVRPDDGEQVLILDADGQPVTLPDDVPELVLINTESWRTAVTTGRVVEIQAAADAEKQALLDGCIADLGSSNAALTQCATERLQLTDDLADAQEELPAAKRRAFGAGAGVGAGSMAVVLLLILLI